MQCIPSNFSYKDIQHNIYYNTISSKFQRFLLLNPRISKNIRLTRRAIGGIMIA